MRAWTTQMLLLVIALLLAANLFWGGPRTVQAQVYKSYLFDSIEILSAQKKLDARAKEGWRLLVFTPAHGREGPQYWVIWGK